MDTTRFGKLENYTTIHFKDGILGYEKYKDWTLVNPQDSTFILWLQSLDLPQLAIPVIKSKFINESYSYENTYNVLMIPTDIVDMSANAKAPLVIKDNSGSQVMDNDKNRQVQKKVYKILKKAIINNTLTYNEE